MATEFICAINKTGEDYGSLSDWDLYVAANLTAATTKVIAGTVGTAPGDGQGITQDDTGATATCVHATATQMMVVGLSGSPNNSSDWVDDGDAGKTFTPSDTGDTVIAVAEVFADKGDLVDSCTIDGWTTNATNYIVVRAAAEDVHDGTAGSGATLAASDHFSPCIVASEVFTQLLDLTAHTNSKDTSVLDFGVNDVLIARCICYLTGTAYNNTYGIRAPFAGGGEVRNNICYDLRYGISIHSGTAVNVWNNTVADCYGDSFQLSAADHVVKNNVANGTGADADYDSFSGALQFDASSTHNISEDETAPLGAESTNGSASSASAGKLIDSTAAFLTTAAVGMRVANTSDEPNTYSYITSVDSNTQVTLDSGIFDADDNDNYGLYFAYVREVTFNGSDDFHLGSGDTAADSEGVDLSGTGFTDDIDGDTRAKWSIGADDGVAVGGGGGVNQIIGGGICV